jgi:hypothetical protein
MQPEALELKVRQWSRKMHDALQDVHRSKLSEEEALYICALLNSSAGDFATRSFFSTGGGRIGAPVVLEHIRIPRFDRKNPVHLRLAELSMQAHEAAKIGDEMRLREIEAEIDRQAAQLWGLSEDELCEIQQSLRELAGEEQPQAEEIG